jgi:hypothetical protein
MAENPLALIIGGLLLIGIAYAASQIGQDLIKTGVQQSIRQRQRYYLTG